MPNPLFMLVLLFVIMLAVKPDAGVDATAGGGAPATEQVADLSRAWLDAYFAGDIEDILAIMHEDAVVMPHDQPDARGEAGIRDYLASRTLPAGLDFSSDPGEVRINGDWAYARGRFTVDREAATGEPGSRQNGRYLLLYEKVDGDWKVLKSIDSMTSAR